MKAKKVNQTVKKSKNDNPFEGDVLITTQTESFLLQAYKIMLVVFNLLITCSFA